MQKKTGKPIKKTWKLFLKKLATHASLGNILNSNEKTIVLLIVVLAALFVSLQYLWFNLSGREIMVRDITAITGEQLSMESFVSIPDASTNVLPELFRRYAKPISKWDMLKPGEQKIKIFIYNYAGYIAIVSSELRIVEGHTRVYAKDELMSDEITVWDFIDSKSIETTAELVFTPDKPAFDSKTSRYYYDCVIRLDGRDIPCELWTFDKTPPVIAGVRDFDVTQGSSILFRAGVTVKDNFDENVKLEVESEAVSSKPGIYPVIYRAVDESGNETMVTANVTVIRVEEAFILKKSDEILAQILKDSMTRREKATAIYKWARGNLRYAASPNEEDPILSAYEGFNRMAGNCYTYYAICEVLLTRAGVPNMHIERPPSHRVTHHWNLVNVEEGWFHFDAYPAYVPIDGCLFTEYQAEYYTELQKERRIGYYDYVKENYPPIVQGERPVADDDSVEAPVDGEN